MPANTSPIFTLTPVSQIVQIATANTARDGTGTLGAGPTGATNGTRIETVRFIATGTTTAGVLRIFIDDGTNIRLAEEILVTAITPSTTVRVFTYDWKPPGTYALPSTHTLRYGTHNAETFNVHTIGGSY